MEIFKYCKVREVKSPSRGTNVAAGIDFYIPTDITPETWTEKCNSTKCHPVTMFNNNKTVDSIILAPGDSVLIPSGIKMKVPNGYAMVMMNKSGVGSKKQLSVLACVIDEDYQGEVHLNIANVGKDTQIIKAGDKLVQGLIIPVNYAILEEVKDDKELFKDSESERGDKGFGSTDNK